MSSLGSILVDDVTSPAVVTQDPVYVTPCIQDGVLTAPVYSKIWSPLVDKSKAPVIEQVLELAGKT